MIQKVAKQTEAEKRAAYRITTERDSELCVRCRRAPGTNRDHRKNRSQGGRTTPANLQLLCGSGTTGCHGWVTEHPKEAIEEGWACPGYAEPADWPARRWMGTHLGALRLGWALYDDRGGITRITEVEAMERMGR